MRHHLLHRCLLALLLLASSPLAVHAAPCQPPAPAEATLAGTLVRETFAGAPNYESVQQGDAAETGFYLRLRSPICLDASADGQVEAVPQGEGGRLVQVVLDAEGYRLLRPWLGHAVVLRGTLFSAITGHHHTPVLMTFGAVR